MERVKLKDGNYSLEKVGGHQGDSGKLLHPILGPGIPQPTGENGTIEIGQGVLCGSPFAGTYSTQDYWMTSLVTEIVKVNDDNTEVEFITRSGSTYIARSF